MNLKEINFPVYPLKDHPPQIEGGVVFYLAEAEDGKLVHQVVDNRNMDGTTLGRRRLLLKKNEVRLHKLKYALYFLSDLLKLSGPNKWFIDNFGKVFRYTKSKFVKLTYRKIISVHRVPGATLIEVMGVCGRYMVLYPPNNEEKYAAFLELNKHSLVFYGYADKWYPDSRKKI